MPDGLLVLWDIDHTLVDTRGMGRELWAAAFHEVTGVELREQASIEGLTEPVNLRETARLHGVRDSPELFESPEVRQTVVTGNIRAAAEVKLTAFGLERELNLDSGSFGEDADERPGLVRVALRRSDTPAEHAVLLGDTPADVRGGLAHGVRVVGVATGRTSAADLTAAGAAQVLPDLADTERALRLIVG
ncbi:HAD hydrolase-like protein [Streptomyces youssoufiensis]